MTGIRVTKISIRDYRGIHALECDVPPAGIIIEGKCRSGKTSVLRALKAAIAGEDVDADAIRHGATDSEIFISLDTLALRRNIDQDGTRLTANTSLPGSKQKAKVGQKYLDECFGRSLSPMALFRAKPAERKSMIMEAMTVSLTTKHLEEWVPAELRATLPATFHQAWPHMHGLEAIKTVHQHVYEARAVANLAVKTAKSRVELLAEGSSESTQDALVVSIEDALKAEKEAASAFASAQDLVDANIARATAAHQFSVRSEETIKRVAEYRKEAEILRQTAEKEHDLDVYQRACQDAKDAIAELEIRLADLRKVYAKVCDERDAAGVMNQNRTTQLGKAEQNLRMAFDLEASLAVGPVAPSQEEMNAAANALRDAHKSVEDANRVLRSAEARSILEVNRAEVARLETTAASITKTVDFLRTEAPSLLIKEAKGIPGLGIDGTELTIDGVKLDALSGAEQLKTCIEVSKRAALLGGGDGRVLITDGLEALDDAALQEFVRLANDGGWQLIATRVTNDDFQIEALTLDGEEVGA